MKLVICHHLSLTYGGGGEWAVINMANEAVKRGYEVEVRSLPFWRSDRINPEEYLREGVTYSERLRHPRVEADISYYLYAPYLHKFCPVSGARMAGFHSLLWFTGPTQGYSHIARLAYRIWRTRWKADLAAYHAYRVYFDEVLRMVPIQDMGRPIYVIGPEVDTDLFVPMDKWGEFTVLYVGRPVRQKGFDIFLDAARKVGDRMNFLLAGSNVKAENVKSLGYLPREKLAEVVSKSHVLVSMQRVPTLSRAVLEALSAGTISIVSTEVYGPYRNLKSLIRANNLEELVANLINLKRLWLRDREEFLRISESGRELVVRMHSRDKVMDRLFSAFKYLKRGLPCQGRGSPRGP